jgi:hypothetical protein
MTDQTEADRQREFEKAKICFEQNSEHLRSLNGFMWQTPLIAMTLTGGLWFGIAQLQPSSKVIFGLLIFAALTNFSLILVMRRMRFIFERILNKTKEFHPTGIADTKNKWLPDKLVSWIFSLLLGFAAVLSGYGAYDYQDLLKKDDPKTIRLISDSSLFNFNCNNNPPLQPLSDSANTNPPHVTEKLKSVK